MVPCTAATSLSPIPSCLHGNRASQDPAQGYLCDWRLCMQSTYTGVHARGGPSTVEPSKDLSALLNRSEAEAPRKDSKPGPARSARRPPTPEAFSPQRPGSTPLASADSAWRPVFIL